VRHVEQRLPEGLLDLFCCSFSFSWLFAVRKNNENISRFADRVSVQRREGVRSARRLLHHQKLKLALGKMEIQLISAADC